MSARQGGNTFLVSVAEDGKVANRGSVNPSVDGDGGRVAFESTATNLSNMANHVDNVYVRDIGANQVFLASRSGGGSKAIANGDSSNADIPRDGRFVCFQSVATNLGNPYDGFGVNPRVSNVYVHDLLHHGTFLISRQTGRYSPGGNGDSTNVSCSAGASLAAYQSTSSNLSGGIRRRGDGRLQAHDLRRPLTRPRRWARLVSNQRPLACEASALPLSYGPGSGANHRLAGQARAGAEEVGSSRISADRARRGISGAL